MNEQQTRKLTRFWTPAQLREAADRNAAAAARLEGIGGRVAAADLRDTAALLRRIADEKERPPVRDTADGDQEPIPAGEDLVEPDDPHLPPL